MFRDRPYLRMAAYRPPRSLTITLLIVNAIVFLAQGAVYGFPSLFSMRGFAFPEGSLFPLNLGDDFRHFHWWQLLTYQFLHGNWLHLLLNSWAIYLLGREVEDAIGRKAFLLLYISSGLIGGLLQLGAAVVIPEFFGRMVVGASACAFGLVAVFASLYPERPLTVLLYIIPVSLRAKYLLVIASVIALFGIAFPLDNIAHAAHLGGILTGMAFVRHILQGGPAEVTVRPAQIEKSAPPQSTVTFVTDRPGPPSSEMTEPVVELETAEFMRRQVDPILDKIHSQGIHSLTRRERDVLEKARQRMAGK